MRYNYKDKSINVIGTKEHIQGRINSYKRDEPKTVRWIESFDSNGIFYDVGSNIGGFSFLTKMIHSKMIVFSFEPNYLNYMVQVETIRNNEIKGLNPINMALNDCDSYDFFHYESDKEGSKGNFGDLLEKDLKESKWGNPFKKGVEFKLPIMGMSLDSFIQRFKLPNPTYLKIDVDGNEGLVVDGMKETLKSKDLKEIMIEVDEMIKKNSTIYTTIESHGFTETLDIYYGEGMRMKLYVR